MSFSSAVGLPLTDSMLDAYIDPSIQGFDRSQAKFFLKLMPANLRGDFVYIRPNGTLLSNRTRIYGKMTLTHGALSSGIRRAESVQRKPNATAFTHSVMPNTNVAPPNSGQGGPYAREYSLLGVDAAYGYASSSCDYSLINPITGAYDDADMYFGGFGNFGNGSGIDAGIQFSPSSLSSQPFLSVSASGGYQSFKYETGVHYLCGTGSALNSVGIMYGGIASAGVMFLATGIPDYNPTEMQLPPAMASWSGADWTYFSPPGDFVNRGNDSLGQPTLCATCITKRMTTIAQTAVDSYTSRECAGMCGNNPISSRWDDVVMGNLIQPCTYGASSFLCTIAYFSFSWFGGYQVYPDTYAVQTNDPNPNQGYEGINLANDYGGPGVASKARHPSAGTLSWPLPIAPSSPCPPDSHGYCGAEVKETATSCHVGPVGDYQYFYAYTDTYEIFSRSRPSNLLGTVTSTEHFTNKNCAVSAKVWAPAEPAVTYNDPYLP